MFDHFSSARPEDASTAWRESATPLSGSEKKKTPKSKRTLEVKLRFEHLERNLQGRDEWDDESVIRDCRPTSPQISGADTQKQKQKKNQVATTERVASFVGT